MKLVAKYFMWAVWLASAVIWIFTLYVQIASGRTSVLLGAACILLLLAVLYFAEGLEIAFADLRDKDPAVTDPATRPTLTEMQQQEQFFFAQRQIFVVAIISFVALLMEKGIDSFSVPYFGAVTNPIATFAINFVFLNLTVLWFCQVTPKRLAVINSETFLQKSKFVWPLIKWVGRLNIPGPSEDITKAFARSFNFNNRMLPPSHATMYSSVARLLGQAIDQSLTTIKLKSDGSGAVERRQLTLYIHGKQRELTGEVTAGTVQTQIDETKCEVGVAAIARLDPVENFREYEPELEAAFAAGRFAPGTRITPLPLADFGHRIRKEKSAPNVLRWHIDAAKQLPEGYWSNGSRHIIALLSYARFDMPPGAFTGLGTDWWQERVLAIPCRRHELRISAEEQDCVIGPINLTVNFTSTTSSLEDEVRRYVALFSQGGSNAQGEGGSIYYPLQSSIMRYDFELMKVRMRKDEGWTR